ncbi:MAG TPA: VOC family protein [Rhizomicrobium sp.]|jgi:catechol 2,3-dioxygenase-like lactoylglutathione lyase family enzyme|nr:VOC family protein [Rhizomicrobium sp.]
MTDDANPPSLRDRKLVQIALTSRDIHRSRHFYCDVLGLPVLFEGNGMVFFELPGLRLMIGSENSAGAPGGSILYFDAPDIDTLAPALEKKGVQFLGPAQTVQTTATHDLKLRVFRDPDGNTLALIGMVARG